jgi:deazaflavin-dependent oxidoreductase (nitroreductase family)
MPRETPKEIRERDDRYRVRTRAHVARYVASDGADGYDDNDHKAPTLLLTTTGRKSGQPYTTPLNFAEDNGTYVLIGSYGGASIHPKWYLNLLDHPEVEVQVKAERFAATAHPASGHEKERLWRIMADRMPFYDSYRNVTERDIPLIVLKRTSGLSA